MSDYFKEIPHITFEGKESQNPLSFKYYDSEKIVLGKKLEEHLLFQESRNFKYVLI